MACDGARSGNSPRPKRGRLGVSLGMNAMIPSRPPSLPPLAGSFLSAAALERFVASGQLTRRGALLSFRDGRRLVAQEAVRILGRRASETDPFGLTGLVLTLGEAIARGAVLSGDGLRLGAVVYDVDHGVSVMPLADAESSGVLPRP